MHAVMVLIPLPLGKAAGKSSCNFIFIIIFNLKLSNKVQSAVVRLFNSVFLFLCLFKTYSLPLSTNKNGYFNTIWLKGGGG